MDVFRATRKGLGRKRMNKRKDRKFFSRNASKMRRENFMGQTMRGGTRL